MHQIIALIRKYRYFLLFLILECIGLLFTVNYHDYQRSKYINASNAITGGIAKRVFNFNNYFKLSSENEGLITENLELRKQLYLYKNLEGILFATQQIDKLDSISNSRYEIIPTKVISNQYRNLNNILLIEKGTKDSVGQDMALINDKGVLGIINHSSANYSSALSILNPNIQLNARIKKSNYFGTIMWNGEDYNTVQLVDIPRQASLKIGDSIVTGGKSIIFPDGIPIGRISGVSSRNDRYQKIDVQLFNDMANISNAYILRNKNSAEIKNLEQLNDEY